MHGHRLGVVKLVNITHTVVGRVAFSALMP